MSAGNCQTGPADQGSHSGAPQPLSGKIFAQLVIWSVVCDGADDKQMPDQTAPQNTEVNRQLGGKRKCKKKALDLLAVKNYKIETPPESRKDQRGRVLVCSVPKVLCH